VRYLTQNILKSYKKNSDHDLENSNWYITKQFTNTSNIGFFKPNTKETFAKEWNGKDPFIGTVDEDTTYDINDYGLRGEVYENPDAIAFGCSITFGIGVPESARWTNLLSNKTNKTIMNFGYPGGSVSSLCNNIIHYCMNNKMPKEIFCWFPDFFRSQVVVDKEFYKSKTHNPESNNLILYYCSPTIISHEDVVFMEVENRKYIEDSVSPHQLILNSINSIYALESFCLSNNIKLYWSTWDRPSALVMEELSKIEDFKIKNYTPFFPSNVKKSIGSFIESTCNSNHESEFKDDPFWIVGSDYSIVNSKKTKENAHPGIHSHIHVADFFHSLSNK
jgi:hypothetical protein